MREIRAKLEAEGRKTYVVSFQNSVAAANNGLTLHMFCAAMAAGSIQTPCTVLWDEVFYCPISALARMVKFFRLPEIQWIFVGDWHQPQMEANWRGVVGPNGLYKSGRLSSYLPEQFVYLDNDLRSRCPLLKDFRKRLREAEEVEDFVAEGRRLFTASPPYELTIVVSHAKRRKICQQADKRARYEKEDVVLRPSQDLGEIATYLGLSLRCIEADYNRGLVKGMWYTIVEMEPLTLEETIQRHGEDEKRRVEPSLETFGKKLTRTEAVTAASVQGATIEGRVAIHDLDNPHLQNKSVLEMATGRAVHSQNLCCLEKDGRRGTPTIA